MGTLLERIAAQFAFWHAAGVYRSFERSLQTSPETQQRTLSRVLRCVAGSAYAAGLGLHAVRTVVDFRRAVPLNSYEALRPWIERVAAGETRALFAAGIPVVMFATSSGTTALPKLVPVTPGFVRQYRRGWNTFGLKLLSDHPEAVLRSILQVSGRWDESHTAAGIPCGAITGLLARTQKSIVRRFYVGPPALSRLSDPQAKYYALMRLAVARDVAFAITANPATLIRLAQVADQHSETLIRDVRDGSLDATLVPDERVRSEVSRVLRSARQRAAELERLRTERGGLFPRDYWKLAFLACWTGGSLSHYLPRLREAYGDLPVRDVGLLASEGRVTIPLNDGTPAGVLDPQAAFFEFIPLAEAESPRPTTLLASELEPGQDYVVVLSNDSGLLRYRLDDVVRVRGRVHGTPLLEFLHRAGRISSVAGEKLTENQLVAAMDQVRRELGLAPAEFIAAPCWGDPPWYRVTTTLPASPELAEAIDEALCAQNDEYASRRRSARLGPARVRQVCAQIFRELDRRDATARRSTMEQYKRTYLFSQPGDDDRAIAGE